LAAKASHSESALNTDPWVFYAGGISGLNRWQIEVRRDIAGKGQKVRTNNLRNDKLIFLAAVLCIFMVAASICGGVAPAQDATEPIWPTKEWQTSTPENEGMGSKELAKLVDFGTVHDFDSLLVTRHGKVVAEAYYAPYAVGILHAAHSITKAVVGTLVGILSEEGLLSDVSHRMLDFFDRATIPDLGERKEVVTVQNLLDMTSGLAWDQPPYGGSPSAHQMFQSPDWVKFILDRPMSTAPGSTFNYSDGDAHLLSAIVTKLTGISALEYAKARLFGPLGISETFWAHDPQGISLGGYGLYLQPRDMAKIGYLYLRHGLWEGKQLLPTAWVDRIFHTMSDSDGHSEIQHSNLFWVLPDKHVYMAVGAYRQVIMVFPDIDVVTVTTARVDRRWPDFEDGCYHLGKGVQLSS
jgi:CubicO group peptidase (beta-lactamase class C family)